MLHVPGSGARALLAGLSLCFLAVAASGAGAASIELKYKKPAVASPYVMNADSKCLFTLYGMEKLIVQQTNTGFSLSAGEPKGDGGTVPMTLEITSEESQTDGKKVPATAAGTKVQLELSELGHILSSSDPSVVSSFQDAILVFPGKPVAAGESWSAFVPLDIPEGDGKSSRQTAEVVLTYKGQQNFLGTDVAVVESKLSLQPERTPHSKFQATAEGKLFFDAAAGQIVALNNAVTLSVAVFEVGAKEPAPGTDVTPMSTLQIKMNLKVARNR